jgi:hypothetical protein
MFLGNIQTILQINSTLIPLTEGFLNYLRQKDWEDIKNMPIEPLKQYSNLANELFERQHITNKGITDDTVNDAYKKLQHRVTLSLMLPNFIREMSFVYLMAKFEDFISKQFLIVFTRKREVLKTKDKNVTYQELFSASKLEELWDKIIEHEITQIMMKDLEGINEDLKHFLGIDLKSNTNNWKSMREYFQRRNILLHNNGRINSIYRQKTGHNGAEGHLSVDKEYLSNAIRLSEIYCNEITDKILQKFAKK